MDSAQVVLTAEGGEQIALTISQLPNSDFRPELADRPGHPPPLVTLREAATYRFSVDGAAEPAGVQPRELFDFDDATMRTGRLQTAENVGLIRVTLTSQTGTEFHGLFDVRSAKFADEEAFGTMLSDLANLAVEALHQGFAPSGGQFAPDTRVAPRLIYQQFAVLHSLLRFGDLRWALAHVVNQPHREWAAEDEIRHAGRPMKGSSRLSSMLSRPGPRVPAPHLATGSLPARIAVTRTEETLNTVPNQYLRAVVEQWRALAAQVAESAASLPGLAMRRGVAEARAVTMELDEFLASPLFRDVARLANFPGDNPVLRRRQGYRQVRIAAALIDGSLGLDLGLEDPFLVSRRSVATLYEYWTFVQLASALARACGHTAPLAELFKASRHGMSLVLRAGATSRLQFEATVSNQLVLADLFFNREFRTDSWTRPMRPDASVVIRRLGGPEVWLHFDAKYRVDWEQPFDTGDVGEEEDTERSGVSKRSDLLKMHAYRDAIRSSAGAYVLFPGSAEREYAEYDTEFLPGLGAFPLRPDQAPTDVGRLESFFERALTHVAASGTQHRRAAYWTTRAYDGPGTKLPADPPSSSQLPPADTAVVCGYVRSPAHRDWILANNLYNIRSGERRGAIAGDSSLLAASLLLLYGPSLEMPVLFRRTEEWSSCTREHLLRLGYPSPGGENYFVAALQVEAAPTWASEIRLPAVRPHGLPSGQPFCISWLDLVLSTQTD